MADHEEGDEETFILTDEDGAESDWIIAGIIPVNGKSYAFLVPVEESEEDDAMVMRVDRDLSGEDILADIEDEDELEAVALALTEFLGEGEADKPN